VRMLDQWAWVRHQRSFRMRMKLSTRPTPPGWAARSDPAPAQIQNPRKEQSRCHVDHSITVFADVLLFQWTFVFNRRKPTVITCVPATCQVVDVSIFERRDIWNSVPLGNAALQQLAVACARTERCYAASHPSSKLRIASGSATVRQTWLEAVQPQRRCLLFHL